MKMRLGERIKKARKGKGTQAELAEQIGVHEMTIRRWESGERYPDADMLQKLAAALGTSVSYLMGETDDPQGSVPWVASSPHQCSENQVCGAIEREKIIFEQGEGPDRIRLELPLTAETFAFLERRLEGRLSPGERLPDPSQKDAGEQSA